MINLVGVLSLLALVATIVPPLLFFYDRATLDQTQFWMSLATILWFATAPVWERERQR